MKGRIIASIHANPAATAAAAIAAGGAATILGAWFFQYGLGLPPCPLCLEQRIPYYVAIPLATIVALVAWRKAPRWFAVGGLSVVALAMLSGAALAVYHSGIEWKWWPGPQDCSGPLNPLASRDLLQQLQDINIVRCDEAPWRFLGLSLAGYNVLISLALAAIAGWGTMAAFREQGSALSNQSNARLRSDY
jgi:disulfide bond formation protein DsbB